MLRGFRDLESLALVVHICGWFHQILNCYEGWTAISSCDADHEAMVARHLEVFKHVLFYEKSKVERKGLTDVFEENIKSLDIKVIKGMGKLVVIQNYTRNLHEHLIVRRS